MGEIVLGSEVKDIVSGFKGIATAKVEYLTGCTQYCVMPRVGKDGKMPVALYFDEDRLEVIGKGIRLKIRISGGDQMECPPNE